MKDFSFSRLSLLWKILLSTSVAITLLFAITGWIVEKNALDTTARSLEEESVERRGSTGSLCGNWNELLHPPRRVFVGPAGISVREVVRQVGAADDRRFGTTPNAREHVRDFGGPRAPDDERNQREVRQRDLEERHLDFEGMLARVRHVAARNAVGHLDRDPAERSLERLRARRRKAAERREV